MCCSGASLPAPTLAQPSELMACVRLAVQHYFDAGLVCASPMLRHSTWQRRISSIHSITSLVRAGCAHPAAVCLPACLPHSTGRSYWCAPLALLQLQLLTISAVLPASMVSDGTAKVFRRNSDAERCHVFVNFFGLLYPLVGAMLISARIHRAAPWHGEWRMRWRAWLPCSSCRAGGGSSGSSGSSGGSQRLGSFPRCFSCAVALVRRAFAAADEWLEGVCSFSWCQGSWIGWLASWWPLLGTLWMLSLHLSAKTSQYAQ